MRGVDAAHGPGRAGSGRADSDMKATRRGAGRWGAASTRLPVVSAGSARLGPPLDLLVAPRADPPRPIVHRADHGSPIREGAGSPIREGAGGHPRYAVSCRPSRGKYRRAVASLSAPFAPLLPHCRSCRSEIDVAPSPSRLCSRALDVCGRLPRPRRSRFRPQPAVLRVLCMLCVLPGS